MKTPLLHPFEPLPYFTIARASGIRPADLAADLLPMFESRVFVEAWLEGFHTNFAEFAKFYLG